MPRVPPTRIPRRQRFIPVTNMLQLLGGKCFCHNLLQGRRSQIDEADEAEWTAAIPISLVLALNGG